MICQSIFEAARRNPHKTYEAVMKKFLTVLIVVAVYVPIHFYVAFNYEWARNDLPAFVVDTTYDACYEANRRNADNDLLEQACRCMAKELSERFYLEDYLYFSMRVRWDRWTGGDGDMSKFDGGRIADIQQFCSA